MRNLLRAIKQKIVPNFKKSPAKRKLICPICSCLPTHFFPLLQSHIEMMENHGFFHSLDKFETLSIDSYTCPNCGASDRDRLYALYLEKVRKNEPDRRPRLLEIAPAPALSSWIKKKGYYQYRSCDLFMDNVDDRHVDIMDMKQYSNGSFDAIICSHVLEHVADDKVAAKELYRILTHGGWAIIMAPISLAIDETREDASKTTESERWKHYAQGDHVRLYSKNGFIDLLKNSGFSVQALTILDFDNYAFLTHGIDTKSVLYIAHKN